MIAELERLDDLGAELARVARASGVLLIWRAQSRRVQRLVRRAGRQELATADSVSGHGVQVVTDDGRVALGSRDDFRAEPAIDLLGRVCETAARGAQLGLAAGSPQGLEPVTSNVLCV